MRLKRLLLQAFGPFTGKEIDFSGKDGHLSANLHLIYGPNEAGKSSALRAMTDLRFEIPVRSSDNFIHENNKLRIAGEFVDANGESVCLVRRKGRGSTLSRFDIVAGEMVDAGDASREHQLALTDGLEREEFEAVFGLNHQRLRAGGKLLLKGEGELGSALFEASAGSRGISDILSGLEAESKKYFSPRASSSVINAVKKELDEQRKRWKKSLTRPAEWQSLNRAHEQAKDVLAEIDKALETMRRRDNELTELRTVAPLLQEYDHALALFQSLVDVPDLPANAREQRLAAEQATFHALNDIDEAESELIRCTEDLGKLVIEPALLEHDDAIERLAASIESVHRSSTEVNQQQSDIEHAEDTLLVLARRISPDLPIDEIIAAQPSDADLVELTSLLDEINRLTEKHKGLVERINDLDEAEKLQPKGAPVAIDPVVRQSLHLALQSAQSLGEVSRQITGLESDIRALDVKLARSLSDINIASDMELRDTRPLMESQIAHVRTGLGDLDTSIRKLKEEDRLLINDLEEQKFEQQKLEAEGEVVTFDTVMLAREHRNKGWGLIRQIYVEKLQCADELVMAFDPDQPLPEAFESAQGDADRQADLLRADAERTARFEVSSGRIKAMEKRRSEIADELESLMDQRKKLEQQWQQQLTDARLPFLQPESLHEWQTGRCSTLDILDRLAEMQVDHSQLTEREKTSLSDITIALQAVGLLVSDSANLSSLIEQAVQSEKGATEADAERSAQANTARERKVDHERLTGQCEQIESELHDHNSTVHGWCTRLFLQTDSGFETVKARLAELGRVSRGSSLLAESKLRMKQSQAVIDDFEKQAHELAALLVESVPEIATDFASRLRRRLSGSKEQEQKRKTLEQDQNRFAASKLQADDELKKQSGLLTRLCESAGVDKVDQLAEQEDRATQKRQAQHAVETQHSRLLQASARQEEELREKLDEQDAVSIDAERERTQDEISRLEQEQGGARTSEEETRRALETIDTSDAAAAAREAMESAAAKYRSAIRPWTRLKIAHALLQNAMNRFKDRAQAPMVASASKYFSLMTEGRYVKLLADESEDVPVLMAEREDGASIRVEEMSEGTADQLYLALRLASLELRRSPHSQMPLILDDVLITSDDKRSANILKALAKFAEAGQVMLFTHHRHLIDLARNTLSPEQVAMHDL
ncbi:MAG: AAA family ATPase [Mariprofundaceae bacterium]